MIIEIERLQTPGTLSVVECLLQHKLTVKRATPIVGVRVLVAVGGINLAFGTGRPRDRGNIEHRRKLGIQSRVAAIHVWNAS